MVAITVILAAVIAAFVFGLAGTTSTSKNVGITVTANTTNFTSTIQGGTDLPTLSYLRYSVNGTDVGFLNGTAKIKVGDSYVGAGGIGSRIVLVGYFQDGSTQVLYDRQF